MVVSSLIGQHYSFSLKTPDHLLEDEDYSKSFISSYSKK